LKSVRNLYLVVAGIVACSLIVAALAEYKDPGFGAGVCYIFAAVGVIWLGWYWWQFAGQVTSMVRLLDRQIGGRKSQSVGRKSKAGRICQLRTAIEEHLDNHADCIARLEKQIEDLQIHIQLAQRQKRNAEAIIYSIRDAVIVVDEYDRLLMANEAAGRIFSFDFRNSQHTPIGELIEPGKSQFVDFLCQSRESKVQARRREIEFPAEDKSKIFDCIVSCVYGKDGQLGGVVAVLHDITREKEISQMKNEFVSHVSHELKTPLASITAYSEMLLDGEAQDSRTREEFYSVIQSQAERLNRLIEDILNISRIESGLVKVEKEPVSLTILIEEQLQMIRSYAEEKDIEVIGQKPIVFDQVYVDKDMIRQVVVNLLGNAVKYTRRGGSIRIESEVDEIAGTVRVSIADTGVGIRQENIEHVFDKFYRVKENEKQAKGTGLGLNLVKQIIEKVHDGRVFVTSQVGVGSTFGFELPLATSQVVGA